ncbi:hypothetical protein SDC9_204017 [bioreactor metagenome]|uniref:Uncharacterized protein n=1 Tax=bioreactor metagenome TaxID=1076179 RepID=A0A645J0T9_9ZZZZ
MAGEAVGEHVQKHRAFAFLQQLLFAAIGFDHGERVIAVNALGVHLRGRAQDHGIDLGQCQAFGQIGCHMLDAVFVGHFLGLVKAATDQGDDFHAVDVLDAVKVLDAEGTSASQRYFDGLAHDLGLRRAASRRRSPPLGGGGYAKQRTW